MAHDALAEVELPPLVVGERRGQVAGLRERIGERRGIHCRFAGAAGDMRAHDECRVARERDAPEHHARRFHVADRLQQRLRDAAHHVRDRRRQNIERVLGDMSPEDRYKVVAGNVIKLYDIRL